MKAPRADGRGSPESPDVNFVAQAKAGELSAFEALLRRRRRTSLARRMLSEQQDAEDVTQQAFLGALEHLGGFRGEASFKTWLLRASPPPPALKVIRKQKGLDTFSWEEACATTEATWWRLAGPRAGRRCPHPGRRRQKLLHGLDRFSLVHPGCLDVEWGAQTRAQQQDSEDASGVGDGPSDPESNLRWKPRAR